MTGELGGKKLWIGIGISLIFLVFLFRSINGEELLRAFQGMEPRYIFPAIAVTFLSYFFRAVRWKYLLSPLKKIPAGNLFSATIIGYMANNILPARLGEFVRAYVLGEQEQLDTSAVFATLVLDRLSDGFTVLILLLLTLFTLRFPAGNESVQNGLVLGGYVTLAIYLVVVAFLVVLKRNTVRTLHFLEKMLRPFPKGISGRIIPLLGSFLDGVRLSTQKGELFAIGASSVVVWGLAILPIDLVLRSFGISLPLTVSMFVLVLLVFAVMVPASPGFVGTYHAACVYGLLAFGIPREKALSVAIIVHGINFFPVIVAGFVCLWKDNLSLVKLGKKSAQ